MYFPKYSTKKSKSVLKLETLYNGNVSFPKWLIVVGAILLAGSLAVLAASLGIALSSQPNGLYNQSCSARSCENKLGLKCINEICLCPENQFYLDKCYSLSSYDGICQQNDHCKQDELLVCGIGSKCSCSNDRYWNSRARSCSLRKKFNEACGGDECLSPFVCQSQMCQCPDTEKMYYDGNNCVSKKNYNQTCSVSNECLDSEKTICQNSKCSCTKSEYFQLSELKCVPKLNELELCSYDEMCLEPMFCSIRFGCRCPRYHFYESVTSSCTNQYVIGSTCSSDHQCRQDLGLTCQNGICLCSSPKFTWSSKSIGCRLTYQQSVCNNDSDCNESEKLNCQLTVPSSSSHRTCDCTKIENNENYWDGSVCAEAKTYRSDCSLNEHCKTLSENTFCSALTNRCECPNLHYWDGLKCLPKKSHLQTCTDSFECMESQFLYCDGTQCVCDDSMYFDVNTCVYRLGELEPCFSSDMCLQDMICNNTHCICDGNNYFTDTECVPQKQLNQNCDKDIECWSERGLICESNKCVCKSSYTWSSTASKCLLTYGQKGCDNNNNQCNEDENLMCIDEDCNCEIESVGNMCDCSRSSNPEQYWNGLECIDAKEFNFPCTFDYECRTRSQKTHCFNSTCICFNFSVEYWDTNECRPKKNYLQDCSKNEQCMDSELTVCANDGKCRCREGYYFDSDFKTCVQQLGESEKCEEDEMCLGELLCSINECTCGNDKYFKNTTNECAQKKSYKAYCDGHNECSNEKNLICLNNECLCNDQKYTWDTSPGEEKCKYTYTTECTSDNECDESKNLKCTEYPDRCNCPSSQSGKICDCKKDDEYWNGFECVDRKSYSSSCNFTNECKNELICLDKMCRCQFFEKKEGGDGCKKECSEDSVYFGGKCYFFTQDTSSANEADDLCDDLRDWELAEIRNDIENEFISYVRYNNITDAFWIKGDHGVIKNFKIDSFNTDIPQSSELRVICLDD